MKTKKLSAYTAYCLVFIVVLMLSCSITNAAQHTISGVPDYQQNYFPGNNDCAPTASASVLGYARWSEITSIWQRSPAPPGEESVERRFPVQGVDWIVEAISKNRR